MLCVSGMTVTALKDGIEMLALLRTVVGHTAEPFSIRWPRVAGPSEVPAITGIDAVSYGSWQLLREGEQLAILAVGAMVRTALVAADTLAEDGICATVVNCRFLKPYDRAMLEEVVARHRTVLTVEEGSIVNGFGAFMARGVDTLARPSTVRLESMGIPDRFVEHGPPAELLAELGLDAAGIRARLCRLVEHVPQRAVARESA